MSDRQTYQTSHGRVDALVRALGVHHALPERLVVVVARAVLDARRARRLDGPVVVPGAVEAVLGVGETGADVLRVVGKGAVDDAQVGPRAVAAERVCGPHGRAEGVARVGVLGLVPPRHRAGVVALVAQHALVCVDVPAVPGEELALGKERQYGRLVMFQYRYSQHCG